MRTVTKTVYVAADGTEFATADEATRYERVAAMNDVLNAKILANRTLSQPMGALQLVCRDFAKVLLDNWAAIKAVAESS